MPYQHADSINLANQVSSTIVRAGQDGFLSDASVAAAGSRQGLKNTIAAVRVPADQENLKILFLRAIDLDPNLTDANIAATTTVAGLAALTGASGMNNLDILE